MNSIYNNTGTGLIISSAELINVTLNLFYENSICGVVTKGNSSYNVLEKIGFGIGLAFVSRWTKLKKN
jgi:hypothetical protein